MTNHVEQRSGRDWMLQLKHWSWLDRRAGVLIADLIQVSTSRREDRRGKGENRQNQKHSRKI